MTKPMIKFPSIEQFKHIVQQVRKQAEWNQVPSPKIEFWGSVKVHGTSSSAVRPVNGSNDEMYFQSRERVLDIQQDNAGFCAFATGKREVFGRLMDAAQKLRPNATGYVQIYGEWFGGNIQKKVGVCNLTEKTMMIYGIRISENAESTQWFSPAEIQMVGEMVPDRKEHRIYSKTDFPSFFITIDFADPYMSQNALVDMTMAVEEDCPVTRTFFPEGDLPSGRIGEGIVWEAVYSSQPEIDTSWCVMKCKGERHASGGTPKVIIPVDEVKLNSVKEFVDAVATQGRLEQMMQKVVEKGLDPTDNKNIGEGLRWFMSDVFKEEIGMLTASGLCAKDVNGSLSKRARDFYLNWEQ